MSDGVNKLSVFDCNNAKGVGKINSDPVQNAASSEDVVEFAISELFSNLKPTFEVGGSGLEALAEFTSSFDEIQESQKVLLEQQSSPTRPKNNEVPKLYEGSFNTHIVREKEYDFTNLPVEYEYDGEIFHCVAFSEYIVKDKNGNEVVWHPQNWSEVQKYFNNAGVINEGRYGKLQCQNYSDMLGQFVLGVANMDFVQSLYSETNDPNFPNDLNDQAGNLARFAEFNPRNYVPCKAANRDFGRAIIENELQNGRPSLVLVNDHHWCVNIGISDDGDLLIWDALNGYIKKMYRTASGNQPEGTANPSERNMSYGDRTLMVYLDGYHFENGNNKAIDYIEDYVNGSVEKALVAGKEEQE